MSLPVGMHCHGYVHARIQKYWGGGGCLGPTEKVLKVVFPLPKGGGGGVGISL